MGKAVALVSVLLGAGLIWPSQAYAADLDLAPEIEAASLISTDGDMAVDSSGRLYVASKINSPNGRIRVYDDPTDTTTVSTEITGLSAPDGIAVSADGSGIFIAEDGGSKVSYYYRSGASFTAGATISTLNRPVGVWITPDNLLYVALFGDNAVREYAVSGTGGSLSFTLNKTFTGFSSPYGVTVDSSGTLYVSEAFQAKIKAFNASTVTACGSSCAITPDRTITGAATELNGPWFLEADSSGRLYVSNFYDSNILVFSATASGNEAPILNIVGASTRLVYPTGLALDSSANIYAQNGNSLAYRWLKFAAQFSSSASSSGRTEETPPDIHQALPMPVTGECNDVVDDHVAYGTGLTGGWTKTWGEWEHAGAGGWVCSRTLTYIDRLGQWVVV